MSKVTTNSNGSILVLFLLALVLMILSVFGGYFTVRLLIKRPEVSIPNLKYKDLATALEEAEAYGLVIRLRGEKYDSNVRRGFIMEQFPEHGSIVKEGSNIDIYISLGTSRVECPSVVNKSLERATAMIENAFLQVGKKTYINSLEVEKGLIINQSPGPGEQIKRGAEVDLLISKGADVVRYKMPDLVGRDIEAVGDIIKEMRFTAKVNPIEQPKMKDGTILRQYPQAGEPITFYADIQLDISQSSEPSVVTEKKLIHYEFISFKVPDQGKDVRVEMKAIEGTGEKVIFDRKCKPLEKIEISFGCRGDTLVQIYLDGSFLEERFFKARF